MNYHVSLSSIEVIRLEALRLAREENPYLKGKNLVKAADKIEQYILKGANAPR